MEISSVYEQGSARVGAASNCNNGDLTDMCHTAENPTGAPWLSMDLAEPQRTSTVEIYNRNDTLQQQRFGAHVIELSNDTVSWATCFTGVLPSSYGPHTEACAGVARHVRLRLTHVGIINLAEVQVFGHSPESLCEGCPAGTYNDQAAQTAVTGCKFCVAGLYGDRVAQDDASDCKSCPSGLYSDQAALASIFQCKACKAGRYQDQDGQAACTSCEAGQFDARAEERADALVTCKLTANDYVDEVRVDGKQLGDMPWHMEKGALTITFQSSATVLAARFRDNQDGCKNGGFRVVCTCTDHQSVWHGMSTSTRRSRWSVYTAACTEKCWLWLAEHEPGPDRYGGKWWAPNYTVDAGHGWKPLLPRPNSPAEVCGEGGNKWTVRGVVAVGMATACTECPSGMYTTVDTAVDRTACDGFMCTPGRFAARGQQSKEAAVCKACPGGRHTATFGSTQCPDQLGCAGMTGYLKQCSNDAAAWINGKAKLQAQDPGNCEVLAVRTNAAAQPAFADLDRDGDLDALIGGGNGTILVIRNNGNRSAPKLEVMSGSLAWPRLLVSHDCLATNCTAIPELRDIDNDGVTDLVVTQTSQYNINAKPGGQNLVQLRDSALDHPYSVMVSLGQFGKDGVFGAAGGVSLKLETWNRTIAGHERNNPYPVLSYGDVNKDGIQDMLIGNLWGDVRLFIGKGGLMYKADAAVDQDIGSFASPVFVDIDGDGDLDIFAADRDNPKVIMLKNFATESYCFYNGVHRGSKAQCSCFAGYYGPQCRSECPGGARTPCNNHGACIATGGADDGTCLCEPGFNGTGCDDCSAGYFGSGGSGPSLECKDESRLNFYTRLYFMTLMPLAICAVLLALVARARARLQRLKRADDWRTNSASGLSQESTSIAWQAARLFCPASATRAARWAKVIRGAVSRAWHIVRQTLGSSRVLMGCRNVVCFLFTAQDREHDGVAEYVAMQEYSDIKTVCLSAFLLLTYFIFPSVSTVVLRAFPCRAFDDGSVFLQADMSIDCNGALRPAHVAYAFVMLCVYPIGIPALYTYMLWQYRESICPEERPWQSACGAKVIPPLCDSTAESNALLDERAKLVKENTELKSMQFLFKEYEPRFWWFESFECFRRLMLTGGTVFFMEGSATQITFGILVALLSVQVYARTQPFIEDDDDLLAMVAQWGVFFTLFGGLVVKVKIPQDDGYGSGWLDSLLILVNAVALLLAGWQIFCAASKAMGSARALAREQQQRPAWVKDRTTRDAKHAGSAFAGDNPMHPQQHANAGGTGRLERSRSARLMTFYHSHELSTAADGQGSVATQQASARQGARAVKGQLTPPGHAAGNEAGDQTAHI
eukprot:g2947.t1